MGLSPLVRQFSCYILPQEKPKNKPVFHIVTYVYKAKKTAPDGPKPGN
jgi:hypothetical protein